MKTFRFSLMLIIAGAGIAGLLVWTGVAAATSYLYECPFSGCSSVNSKYFCENIKADAESSCMSYANKIGCSNYGPVKESLDDHGDPQTCTKNLMSLGGATLQSGGLITKPGVPTLKPPAFQGGLTPQGN